MSQHEYHSSLRTSAATNPAHATRSIPGGSSWNMNETGDHPPHSRLGPPLPPIRQLPPSVDGSRPTLPPVRLPPLAQPQPGPNGVPSSGARAIKIESLLSDIPVTHDLQPYRQPTRQYRPDQAGHINSLDRVSFPPRHDLHLVTPSTQSSESRQSPRRESRGTSKSSSSVRSALSPSTASVSSARSGVDTPVNFSPHISTPRMRSLPPFEYKLIVRQQPVAARACGYGERDRRHIDPPPIVELRITDAAIGLPVQDNEAILAVNCSLMKEEGDAEVPSVPHENPSKGSSPAMMGSSVASNSDYKDERGIAGHFFVFPDLSCRFPGNYRLRFKLLRIDPTNTEPGRQAIPPASVMTDVFRVYIAKDFPGMQASSPLLKALKAQGLQVGLKKGSEERKKKAKARNLMAAPPSPSDSEEGSYSEDDEMERAVTSKKLVHASPQHKRRRMKV